jgi:hypothetical protein
VKHVVFVDSQWHSAHRILRDERLAKVKCVKITKQKTRFWRYQMCGEECLATIEGKTINIISSHPKFHELETTNILYSF